MKFGNIETLEYTNNRLPPQRILALDYKKAYFISVY